MAVAGVTTYGIAAGVAGGSGLHEDLMDLNKIESLSNRTICWKLFKRNES